MIEIGESTPDQLAQFSHMELEADAAPNITPCSPEKHLEEFNREDIVYLTIYHRQEQSGFFILRLEPDNHSVEFRRIVVSSRDQGIGQQAITLMEDYCRDIFQRQRIWLDVFDYNERGRHVYEKLGYRQFETKELDGRTLLFYQKSLD